MTILDDNEATDVRKVTKRKANYRVSRNMAHRCHVCEHLQLHGAQAATCERVIGTVERNYVCDLFDAKGDNDADDR